MAVPVEINHVKAQGIVRITWDDGHSGDYPKEYLRGYCPCALCQGHEAAIEKRFVEVPDVGLDVIEPVGNYAIGFRWSDGHLYLRLPALALSVPRVRKELSTRRSHGYQGTGL